MSRLTGFVLIPAAISLIFVSALGIWLQLTILNQDTFAQSVSDAMTQESSRDAIATAVVDRMLQNRPILQNVDAVRNPAENAISGVLASSLFTRAVNTAANAAWQAVFIRGGTGVTLDLVQAKRVLAGIFGLVDVSGTVSFNPADVPDQIVIVEDGQLPDLRWLHTAGPLVTWISGIAGLALLGVTFWVAGNRERRVRLIRVSGVVLTLEAAGSFLLILLLRSMIVSKVKTDSGEVVLKELLRSFFFSLYLELIVLALVGIVLIAVQRWVSGASRSLESQAPSVAAEPAEGSRTGPEHA